MDEMYGNTAVIHAGRALVERFKTNLEDFEKEHGQTIESYHAMTQEMSKQNRIINRLS